MNSVNSEDNTSNHQSPEQKMIDNVSVGGNLSIGNITQISGEQNQRSKPKTIKPCHNLPQPDYGKFIGREQEKTKLFDKLRPYPHSTNSVITIDGIGGIGKSALALEVSHYFLNQYHNLSFEDRFDAIAWTSAKRKTLRADRGIVDRRQGFQTLDDICETIAIVLGIENIIRSQPENILDLVKRELTQQRTLLIIDNFETVDDDSVNEFITEIPAPTKVIVTTRHRIDVAYPIRLRGMPMEDGQLLIEQECEKKEVFLNDEQKRKLYERTGGVPLAIVWTIGRIGFGSRIDTVLAKLGNRKGDIARFCYEESIEGIKNKDSFKLLLALALCKGNASREELGIIAGFKKDELSRDDGLEELQILSLVNKDKDEFSILPLTKDYVNQELEILGGSLGQYIYRLIDFKVQESYDYYGYGICIGCDYLSKYKKYLSELEIKNSIDILSNSIYWLYQSISSVQYNYDEWCYSWCDFLTTLESIGNEIAIDQLKSWIDTIVSCGYEENISYHYGFSIWEISGCINTLSNLKKYNSIIEIINQYQDKNDIKIKCLEVLKTSKDKTLISPLNKILYKETNEEIASLLSQVLGEISK